MVACWRHVTLGFLIGLKPISDAASCCRRLRVSTGRFSVSLTEPSSTSTHPFDHTCTRTRARIQTGSQPLTFAPMMKFDCDFQRLVEVYHCHVLSSGSGGHQRSSEVIGGHRRSQHQTWSTSPTAPGSASAASSKASPLNRYLYSRGRSGRRSETRLIVVMETSYDAPHHQGAVDQLYQIEILTLVLLI